MIGIVINSVIKFRINFIIVIKMICIGFSNVVSTRKNSIYLLKELELVQLHYILKNVLVD